MDLPKSNFTFQELVNIVEGQLFSTSAIAQIGWYFFKLSVYNRKSEMNDMLESVYHDDGRALPNGGLFTYEYHIKDHFFSQAKGMMGNVRVTFEDFNSNGTITFNEIKSRNDYYSFGLEWNNRWELGDTLSPLNLKRYNGKELVTEMGLGQLLYGARNFMPDLGRFTSNDRYSTNYAFQSGFCYGNNNPIKNIEFEGNYAVSVHYKMTYDAFINAGYSKERADILAHYASTFSDHPPANVIVLDNMAQVQYVGNNSYRQGINYSKTNESQLEKNSMWHSMMSDQEASNGMTREQALSRGLTFAWNSIFSSKGTNEEMIGQGIHALQDAIAHKGMKTNDHLGTNISSVKAMFNDMYGSQKEAISLTKTAVAVIDVLQGKNPTNLKSGDTINTKGMSKQQSAEFLNKLSKTNFKGSLKFY